MKTENFINKAKVKHGDRYDYSLSVYVNNKTKLTIKCEYHGEFLQTPNSHLAGKGCFQCKGKPKKTTEGFIRDAKNTHGDSYGYINLEYVNVKSKVIITCHTHGDFKQRPDIHLAGHGCPTCAKKQRPISNTKDTLYFIINAAKKHNNKYDYSLVKYKNNKSRVDIICPTHGVFDTVPASHLLGQECGLCSNKGGFNSSLDGFVYVLLSECCNHMKIGISNNVTNRVKQLRGSTPFIFSTLDVFSVPGKAALPIEQAIHSTCKSSGFTGFNGATEWFKYDADVIQYLRELC